MDLEFNYTELSTMQHQPGAKQCAEEMSRRQMQVLGAIFIHGNPRITVAAIKKKGTNKKKNPVEQGKPRFGH